MNSEGDGQDQQGRKRPRIESTDEKCIIHYEQSTNKNFTFLSKLSDPQERLEKLMNIQRLRQIQPTSSTQRLDSQIPEVIHEKHGYHRDCYQKFTKNLNRLVTEERGEMVEQPATTRRKIKPPLGTTDRVVFEPDCIFCNKAGFISIYKCGVRTSENTSSFGFDSGETVKEYANRKSDERLLCRIRDLDLSAVGAKYHPNCLKLHERF